MRYLTGVVIWALVLQPIILQPIGAQRPPDGEARPPIHVRGNVTSTSPSGYTPTQVRHAYGVDLIASLGLGQTVALVDAYDDPNIASDLATFKSTFGIPTSSCSFQKVYANGRKPRTDAGWALEISLDVEWVCAIAPQANILLVEAASSRFSDLLTAVDYAKTHAQVVSMSWGGGDSSSDSTFDTHFVASGITFTASSGDSGNGVEYPAASPNVVAVGGTTLTINSDGSYGGETAWSGSGGGVSSFEVEPSYQSGFNTTGKRGVPDVAYDADPNTGVPVYDTVSYQGITGWFQVGGTSAGAPQWAALFAIANAVRGTNVTMNADVYAAASGSSYASNYHDITSGSNGSCGSICMAGTGYDFVTGLGSPRANNLISALAALKQ